MDITDFYLSDAFTTLKHKLIDVYESKNRHYHNMRHINEMLLLCGSHRFEKTTELCIAAWYHDAFNDTTRNDNEERSAELAITDLSPYLQSPSIEFIKMCILASKHTIPSKFLNSEIGFFVDCDLYILSHDFYYPTYKEMIRKEYSNYTDEEFKSGRIKFLNMLIDRNTVYKQFPHRDKAAMRNMLAERSELLHK